jgi:deoxycytidylate deaminase
MYTLLQNVVRFASKWSDDPGTKVGACVVHEGSFTFGANRFYALPEGKTKEEVVADRNLKLAWITHAEVDALSHAPKTEGGVLYVNYTPCDKCAARIADAGIKKVVAPRMTDLDLIARWSKYWVVGQKVLADRGVQFVEE